MATIYDVSLLAGVSLATVSRVVNNNAKVSENTRKKVHQAMQQLGYRPNNIAQSLASNRSNSIGVLMSQLDGPFYGPMMRQIETVLRSANKHAIFAAGHSDASLEQDAIDFLLNRGCDALIIDADALDDETLVALSQQKTPLVVINRLVPALKAQCVHLDNVQGGYLATRHVLEHGHRQLAFITGPREKLDARDRLMGYKIALAEFDVHFNEELCQESDYHEEGGYLAMLELLKADKSFTCVVCANDQMASGAIAACLEQGLQVPADISFIGFDNIPFPRYISPKLTTISNPIEAMGLAAATWILKQTYADVPPCAPPMFKPELIERESIKSLPSR
ncbi:LacI family DNA-binding transcriptional regulator [Shewanella sp. NIFS-20-20]|uniref:LacI family DNA-binding transcriptional regulator n=1 Tax=Shewanella sp. NIFS-20-20 TaxID=2853806 RepID=UPI001C43842E|nr:LacI family DNA-binding transcriptional regulator [Shewanella sp. NIFS-20-20]MBV7314527.1 LacI family DNA-binding transcriptional regulator [Shewanella sp. NIFS-20-20]